MRFVPCTSPVNASSITVSLIRVMLDTVSAPPAPAVYPGVFAGKTGPLKVI